MSEAPHWSEPRLVFWVINGLGETWISAYPGVPVGVTMTTDPASSSTEFLKPSEEYFVELLNGGAKQLSERFAW